MAGSISYEVRIRFLIFEFGSWIWPEGRIWFLFWLEGRIRFLFFCQRFGSSFYFFCCSDLVTHFCEVLIPLRIFRRFCAVSVTHWQLRIFWGSDLVKHFSYGRIRFRIFWEGRIRFLIFGSGSWFPDGWIRFLFLPEGRIQFLIFLLLGSGYAFFCGSDPLTHFSAQVRLRIYSFLRVGSRYAVFRMVGSGSASFGRVGCGSSFWIRIINFARWTDPVPFFARRSDPVLNFSFARIRLRISGHTFWWGSDPLTHFWRFCAGSITHFFRVWSRYAFFRMVESGSASFFARGTRVGKNLGFSDKKPNLPGFFRVFWFFIFVWIFFVIFIF